GRGAAGRAGLVARVRAAAAAPRARRLRGAARARRALLPELRPAGTRCPGRRLRRVRACPPRRRGVLRAVRSSRRDAGRRQRSLMVSASRAERCQWCGAPRGLAREYCLECGSRLVPEGCPPLPWLWPSRRALAVAMAAGGGAGAAAASPGGRDSLRTLVATQRLVTVPAAAPKAKSSTKPTTPPGSKQSPAGSLIPWPGSGYTIVLAAIPTTSGV